MGELERLEYGFGNEHSPTQPAGRVMLRLAGDGTAHLDNYRRAGHRAWEAAVDPAVLTRLAEALRGAGFPDAPRMMPPAGSAMRDLTVSGELRGRVLLPWYEAAEVPGYDRVFAILDGIVAEVSEGAIPAR